MGESIIKSGDSIIFGKQWCEQNQAEMLIDKEVFLMPFWFDYDDDFGGGFQSAPGIFGIYKLYPTDVEVVFASKGADGILEAFSNEDLFKADPMSIYHLFGNDLEGLLDCTIVKGKQDSIEFYGVLEDVGDSELASTWSVPKDMYKFMQGYPYLIYPTVEALQYIQSHFHGNT